MPRYETGNGSKSTAEERVAGVIVGIVIVLFGVFFAALVHFNKLHHVAH